MKRIIAAATVAALLGVTSVSTACVPRGKESPSQGSSGKSGSQQCTPKFC